MYRGVRFSSRILIVKTSALGDIIQAFAVLNELKELFPDAEIDWVVEKRFASIVSCHPLVSRTIAIESKAWKRNLWQQIKELRQSSYRYLFDLQGNCKSGLLTLLAKSRHKVGYSIRSVREWPNILAMKSRFEVPSGLNIRLQMLSLIEQFFKRTRKLTEPEFCNYLKRKCGNIEGVRLKISAEESALIAQILKAPELQKENKFMVCPGSKWRNKRLPLETWKQFLGKIDQLVDSCFLLMWGNEEEKAICEQLKSLLGSHALVVDRLDLPVWQNLMSEMSALIAVDSGALHLCGTTSTPSFSLFGPTMPEIFKPLGSHHLSLRGECPYLRSFEKQCPLLRSCPTGACIRHLEAEAIFQSFKNWWSLLEDRNRCAFRPARSPDVL